MGKALGGDELYSCKSCALRPALKTMLGHDGPPTSYWRENLVNGNRLDRCPVRTMQLADPKLARELEMFRFEIYPFWKKGHFPRAGGAGDQSARELAMLRELDRVGEVVKDRYSELRGDNDAEG